MALRLLDIGTQTELLTSCRLSLLMGVYTDDNRIAEFLKFARGIVQVDNAVLAFKNEPYIWYASEHIFKAFMAEADDDRLDQFFAEHSRIDRDTENYQAYCDYMQELGLGHQRLVAFDLKYDQDSIGKVILFDDQVTAFEAKQLKIVEEFVQSLVNIIQLRVENAELKEAYEQQSALNFSKTKFFQIIAHDLRAPFHGLLGFSEVLAQERHTLDDSSVQNIADYLYDTTQSTYNLLESLLNWAMAEGGRFVYHPINFDLHQSAKIVSDVLNSLAVKKNIRLINAVPEGIKVNADINMITSVMQNLVSNALKFTHTDGRGVVTISADRDGERVVFTIQDTGLGMTQAQIDDLFQQKLTVSIKGTAGERGTGLGLVLCKRFVDLNQGEIVVNSKEGEGTQFKVWLPQATSLHQTLSTESSSAQKDETLKDATLSEL
ncbi:MULTISPECIES: sensor histidine kinase [unclassified Acinetobacter]|uniref:sensor histidine kinase n=2 Tax=Acinetobacter TaxID=469 RepID=UPI0015D35751|nr:MULTISPECIES: HAMP domain-containing sensor histidine kinase [unclassified Acinetobacter]UIJ76256.1 HAMP domain-containing histidine kinase [Acinetobacter sp. SH20PTE14]